VATFMAASAMAEETISGEKRILVKVKCRKLLEKAKSG
jgi:hypothetical protein